MSLWWTVSVFLMYFYVSVKSWYFYWPAKKCSNFQINAKEGL